MPTLNPSGLIELSDEKVRLKPYRPRPFHNIEYMIDQEILDNAGGTLVFDIEVYVNYFLIAFKSPKLKKYIRLEVPFNQYQLSWILHNYTVIGFNSIKFDMPVLWCSYANQDINQLYKLSYDLIANNLWPQQVEKDYNFKIHYTPHIDLIEVAPLKGSLKLYGARLHCKRLQELPFHPSTILTSEQKEIVANYCFNDLDVTEDLLIFMEERIELRRAMSAEYKINLMSKSDAQIAEAVINKEVAAINGSFPKRGLVKTGTKFYYKPPAYLQYQTKNLQELLERIKAIEFEVNIVGKVTLPDALKASVSLGGAIYRLGIGGLHSSEENVSYKATDELLIIDRDVTSYYPRLVTTLGLYPISMGPAFLTVYEKIIQSRIAAKEAKRKTEANGKKIVVNGAGGKFSDEFSTLHGPDLTIQMTVTGQLDLLLFIEMLHLCGFTVISANTDGIVTLVPKSMEAKYEECVKYWENITGFQTEETRYKSYYARDVNSYFAVKDDNTVKMKGPWAEVGSQSGTKLDTNPQTLICTDSIVALLSKGIPIEETIYNCKDFTRFVTVRQCKAPGAHKNGEYLGKCVRWYYAKGELGTINTIAANNKIADSEGGKPCLDLPDTFPDDINYSWYLNKCNEILEDIAYLPRKVQLKLF
jgi:hypothetical protein